MLAPIDPHERQVHMRAYLLFAIPVLRFSPRAAVAPILRPARFRRHRWRSPTSLEPRAGSGAGLGSARIAVADAVSQWNINASTAIFAAGPTAHAAQLSFAMVHGAIYDAVNAIDRSHQPYLVMPQANPGDSKEAAVATAAVPRSRSRRSLLSNGRAGEPGNAVRRRTRCGSRRAREGWRDRRGRSSRERHARRRTNDGRNPTTPFPFVFGTTAGVWRVSPPLTAPDPTPWVAYVKPFLVPNAEMLRTKGPNKLTSKAYAADFNETKSLGSFSSMTRTADQTNAAIFWQTPALGPIAVSCARCRLVSV